MGLRRVNEVRRIRSIYDGHIIKEPGRPGEVSLSKFGKESGEENIAVQFNNHESRG